MADLPNRDSKNIKENQIKLGEVYVCGDAHYEIPKTNFQGKN